MSMIKNVLMQDPLLFENVGMLELTPAPDSFFSLADNDASRRRRYKAFLDEAIPSGEWEMIREAVKRNQLTGNTRFTDAVEQIVGRRIERRGPGRPVKSVAKEEKNASSD